MRQRRGVLRSRLSRLRATPDIPLTNGPPARPVEWPRADDDGPRPRGPRVTTRNVGAYAVAAAANGRLFAVSFGDGRVLLIDSETPDGEPTSIAAHKGAAGDVCTEDLVFMAHEMGIETGIDLDALIGCAMLAEEIVGHPLPGSIKQGGNLARLREAVRQGASA